MFLVSHDWRSGNLVAGVKTSLAFWLTRTYLLVVADLLKLMAACARDDYARKFALFSRFNQSAKLANSNIVLEKP
jgi:hypothetical protein